MSSWDEHITQYPTKLSLTPEELDHLSVLFEDHFAANVDGHRILFARWGKDSLYSQGRAHSWRSLDDNTPVYPEIIRKGFPNEEFLERIDIYQGTGTYQRKEIKWDKNRVQWSYLNNRTVHFNNSLTSSISSPESPAEDDDTARVEEILQRTETTVTSAIQKLRTPSNPSSRPGTPPSRPKTPIRSPSLQTSSVPRTTQSTSTSRPAGSLPTPPVSKGKAPAVPRFATSAFQAPGLAPPPLPAAPPPPPGPNPPNPPAAQAMAQQNQPARPIGNPPDPYDGSPEKATAFWNTLASYYAINSDLYTTESCKVVAALTHFKLGTPAGEWASDQMAVALGQTPPDFGNWDQFKDKFNKQFIPPEVQNEAIQKLYDTPMRNREFGQWYQEWSQHARRANVDDVTKMYAFRRNVNPSIHNKIISMTPQPTTLDDLVAKAREFNHNWRMYTGPATQTPRRGQSPRIRELAGETPDTEINAT